LIADSVKRPLGTRSNTNLPSSSVPTERPVEPASAASRTVVRRTGCESAASVTTTPAIVPVPAMAPAGATVVSRD
jgi:hypothetical protein